MARRGTAEVDEQEQLNQSKEGERFALLLAFACSPQGQQEAEEEGSAEEHDGRAARSHLYFLPLLPLGGGCGKLAEAGGARLPVVARGHVKTRWVDGFCVLGPLVTGPYRDDRRDAMRRSRRPGSFGGPFSVFDSEKKKL